MKSLLRAEYIQLTTTRTALWWAIVVLILTIVSTTFIVARAASGVNLGALVNMRWLDFFVLMFAIVAATGNYRHKVAVTEQLISPTIWQATLAKLIIFGAFGALAVITQTLLIGAIIIVWPTASLIFHVSDIWTIGIAMLGASLSGMLGVAISRLIRVQIAAVLVTIAYFILVEPILVSQSIWFDAHLHELMNTFMPGQALGNLGSPNKSAGLTAATTLTSWIALLAVTAHQLDKKRDWR